MPRRCPQTFLRLGLRDFPERLHRGLAVDFLPPGAVERGRAGIDEVQNTARRRTSQFVAGDAFDGLRTPVGAHVGKNLRGVGEQMTKQHRSAIETIILRRDDVGRADAVPVEGRVQDGLEKIAVGLVIRPLALALETGSDGVVALRFLAKTHRGELGIADHEVAGDDRHLDGFLPFAVELFTRAFGLGRVVIFALRTILLHPRERLRIFGLIENALVHAAEKFRHVNRLDAHSQIILEERLVHDRAGDAHRDAAHAEIGFAAHQRDREPGANEAKDFFRHIGGNGLVAAVLHIGLMGRGMSDAHREWWGRLGGWLVLYSMCWLFLFGISIYFPYALHKLVALAPKLTVTGGLTWVASTLYGVLFGKSASTQELLPDAPAKEKFLGYLARIAPYVFILGFLLVLSLLAAKIAHAVGRVPGTILRLPHEDAFYTWKIPVVCVAFLLATLLLSWRVDVNEFSIHHLYRNRLVRCYLGASVPRRSAQPFTGFSDADEVPLASLQIPNDAEDDVDDRPIPILNTSLNVVRGKELALQTRKARSFAFTPLYAGFTRPVAGSMAGESVYASTRTAAADRINSKFGVRLGTAMAISGAAASPNMGSYSAPDLAFLMTLFDVRLGWWMANPKGKFWRNGSPYLGFYWLLRELLGAANDDSEYVYLSDGGHFENLAIYELVRRRCKVIVACDASCDAAYGCSDLHNAMERCRVDFGVDIEMKADELGKILPDGQPPRATAHFAVGVIHYVPGDPASDGVLIYLKPALVKDDAADLLGYAASNKQFPHDTTANQFFDESHFENYRAMGEATGRTARAAIEQALNKIALLRTSDDSSAMQAEAHTTKISLDSLRGT